MYERQWHVNLHTTKDVHFNMCDACGCQFLSCFANCSKTGKFACAGIAKRQNRVMVWVCCSQLCIRKGALQIAESFIGKDYKSELKKVV